MGNGIDNSLFKFVDIHEYGTYEAFILLKKGFDIKRKRRKLARLVVSERIVSYVSTFFCFILQEE